MRNVVVVALLLVAAISGVAGAQEAPSVANATTTFDAELRANGDADWTVTTVVPIDTAEERDAFRDYGERFVAGDGAAGPGIAFFERAAELASTAAGREMTITGVERDYTVGTDAGRLELRFRWTSFLAASGDGYELSDALLTSDGTWLRSLEAGQEIRIHTPPGYDIQRSIEARQENDSLVVAGPESFEPTEFAVVYRPADPASPPTDTASPTPVAPTPDEGIDGAVVGLVGLLALAVAVLAVWRWRGGESIAGIEDGGSPDGDAAAEPAPEEPEPDPAIDPELLSDEERVEALLEQNGGRMRQAAIVEETDWSDAKVSQLLSRMADDGEIEKLRLGRENVISLPNGEDEP
ncbi:hypothetical protein JCM30237_10240 [Halolamina litorea]|uniref:Helix-turn-helix transcriptional regulator n=1 Tax=Halolamina litorea TaxID=1515593 RepID=A0ABD6BW56_9EURY|nr:hypothetical protein [Halolamina litorea]